jgi:hypothetical protein
MNINLEPKETEGKPEKENNSNNSNNNNTKANNNGANNQVSLDNINFKNQLNDKFSKLQTILQACVS